MKHIPTQGSRKPRSLVSVSLIVFVLLIAVSVNFSLLFTSVRLAYAAALIPVTATALPSVRITNPINNSIQPWKTPVTIVAAVTDSDPNVTIIKVEFYSGTTLLGISTTAPYNITWTPLLVGGYTLTAKAYDNYGDVVTSTPISIYVAVSDPVPLSVSITSPVNSITYNSPATVVIAASATSYEGPISKIDFYNGSTLLGTSTAAPYSFTWTNVPAGTYTLTAVVTTTSGLTSTSPQVIITVLPSSTPTCKVSYQLASHWPGGFQANISIANTGITTLNSWTLKFTFSGDQKITNLWNGKYTQSGEQVTITNQSWNGTIAPKGSIRLGFNGTWTNNNTDPTSFTLNGQVCD